METTDTNCETAEDLKNMLNTSMQNVVSNNNLVTQLTQKAVQNMLSIEKITMVMEILNNSHSEEVAKLKEQIGDIKTELRSQNENMGTLAAASELEEIKEKLSDMFQGMTLKMETLNNSHSEEVAKLKEQIEDMKTELRSQNENVTTLAAASEEIKEELSDTSKGVKILNAEGGLRDEKCAEVCAGTTGREP